MKLDWYTLRCIASTTYNYKLNINILQSCKIQHIVTHPQCVYSPLFDSHYFVKHTCTHTIHFVSICFFVLFLHTLLSPFYFSFPLFYIFFLSFMPCEWNSMERDQKRNEEKNKWPKDQHIRRKSEWNEKNAKSKE